MAHRPNTRPTFIYWLFDARTGVPFYCGKTVLPLHQRLAYHHYEAVRGTRRVHEKVRECGEHVRIQLIEVVPPTGDWGAREKRWVELLRQINAEACNMASGGQGAPGRIVSAETRAKMRAWQVGRKLTEEHKAKVRAANLGKTYSAETIEKRASKLRGKKHSPESIAKMSAVHKAKYEGEQGKELRKEFGLRRKGAIVSLETRAKQSIAKLGRRRTAEEKAKLRAANLGKKMPAEAIAKSAAARTGQKRTPEQRARMSAAHKGKQWSQAQRNTIPVGLKTAWKRRKAENRDAL